MKARFRGAEAAFPSTYFFHRQSAFSSLSGKEKM